MGRSTFPLKNNGFATHITLSLRTSQLFLLLALEQKHQLANWLPTEGETGPPDL